MGEFKPAPPIDNSMLMQALRDRTSMAREDAQMAERSRSTSIQRAKQMATQMVQAGMSAKDAVSLYPDYPGNEFGALEFLEKKKKQEAKLAEQEQTDKTVGTLADQGVAATGGTPSQQQGFQDSMLAAGAPNNPAMLSQLGAAIDTRKQEAAAKAERERLKNRSPMATMAEEGGYSADAVKRIVREKVTNELNSGMTAWEKTELNRLNAGMITQEAYDRRQAQYQDNRLAASGPTGKILKTNPDGTIEIAEGTDAIKALQFRKEWASSQVLQDRLTNAEIASLYMTDMVDMIQKHPTRAIVGGTGKAKRVLQNFQGLLLDVDRQFGVNLGGWAESGAMQLADDFAKGMASGQEMDPELQESLGLFLDNFDPANATLKQLEYIISYNLVAMRQRGTRVSTNAAIDRQAKRLGLTDARSTDGIVSALRTASKEAEIIKRDITRRLETDFNKVRPIITKMGDVPSNNPLITDPRVKLGTPGPPGATGPLNALDAPKPQPGVHKIVNGVLVE